LRHSVVTLLNMADRSYGPGQSSDGQGRPGPTNPLEAFSSYQGLDWTPKRLVFHQNLEAYADKVIPHAGLQGEGRRKQEHGCGGIHDLRQGRKRSKRDLLDWPPGRPHGMGGAAMGWCARSWRGGASLGQ